MKAYKLTILVVDLEEIGEENVKSAIENARYPNRCIAPDVMEIESSEIGEWDDDHPLNKRNTNKAEFERLFKKTCEWSPESREVFALHHEAYETGCRSVVLFDLGSQSDRLVRSFNFCPFCGGQIVRGNS